MVKDSNGKKTEVNVLSRKGRSLLRALRDSIKKKYGTTRAAFKAIDKDNSKTLCFEEFNDLVKHRNLANMYSLEEIKEVYDLIDTDLDGKITVDEAIGILDVGKQSIEEYEAIERDRREAESTTSTRISQEVYAHITNKFSTVRSAFRSFDIESFDNDGTVQLRKFGEAIKRMKLQGVTENDVDKFVKTLDSDGSNHIDYSEFLTKFAKPIVFTNGLYNPFMSHSYKITEKKVRPAKHTRKLTPHERLKARLVAKRVVELMETLYGTPAGFFRHLDYNKDGAISNEELHEFLKQSKLDLNDDDRESFVHYCDSNNTGYISLADFTTTFREYDTFKEVTMPPWLSTNQSQKAVRRQENNRVRTAPTLTASDSRAIPETYRPPHTPGRFDHSHKWLGRGDLLTSSDSSSSWYASNAERFHRKGRSSISKEQIFRAEQQLLAGSKSMSRTMSTSASNDGSIEEMAQTPVLYEKYGRQFARFDRSRKNEQRIIENYELQEQKSNDKKARRLENYAVQRNRWANQKTKTIMDVMYYNDSWRDNTDDSKFDKITQNIAVRLSNKPKNDD